MHQGPVKGKSGMGGMVNVAQKTDVQQLFIQVCTNSGCTNSGYQMTARKVYQDYAKMYLLCHIQQNLKLDS